MDPSLAELLYSEEREHLINQTVEESQTQESGHLEVQAGGPEETVPCLYPFVPYICLSAWGSQTSFHV
jgi:hypothetical protein